MNRRNISGNSRGFGFVVWQSKNRIAAAVEIMKKFLFTFYMMNNKIQRNLEKLGMEE